MRGATPDAPGRFPLLARAWAPLAGLVLAAVAFTVARHPFRAADTYAHLRFGEEFLSGGWSLRDPGSPSVHSTADWVPTQWIGQVGVAAVDRAGAPWLGATLALAVAALAALVFLLARRDCGPAPAASLALLVVLGALPALSLRPQVISYLLFTVSLAGWHRARHGGPVPWWLVPLGWVWAGSHGMWAIGVVLSGVLAIAVVVESRPPARRVVALLGVPAGLLAAALVTPVGPRLLEAVLVVNSRADHFSEWRAPELLTATSAPVTALVAAAVLALVLEQQPPAYDVVLLGVTAVLAVYSTRTLPLAAIAAAAVLAAALRRRRGVAAAPPRWQEVAAVTAVVTAIGALGLAASPGSAPGTPLRPFDADLAALPAGTVVLTDRLAGTVLLDTHPRLDVPIHGYGDVDTDAELEAFDDLAALAPGWRDTVAGLSPAVALLPTDRPLEAALVDAGWQVQRTVGRWALLRPPDAG